MRLLGRARTSPSMHDAHRPHQARGRRRQPRRVRRRGRRRAEHARRGLRVARRAVGVARRELVGGRLGGAGEQRCISSNPASMMCSGSCRRPAAASRRPGAHRGAAHQPRGPDVAEDAALVAQPVHQPRLRSSSSNSSRCSAGMRSRISAALAPTSSWRAPRVVDGDADRPQQRVGHLERVAVRRCRTRPAGGSRRGRGRPRPPAGVVVARAQRRPGSPAGRRRS